MQIKWRQLSSSVGLRSSGALVGAVGFAPLVLANRNEERTSAKGILFPIAFQPQAVDNPDRPPRANLVASYVSSAGIAQLWVAQTARTRETDSPTARGTSCRWKPD